MGDIVLNVVDTCPKCRGSRSEPGTSAVKCPFCNGTGMETVSTGPFIMRTTCRRCAGTKMYIPKPCLECEGKGSSVQRKKITVPVPAGIGDGQTVRMQVGQKEVFITFRVEKSNYFRRGGADIHTDAFISLAQSVLGGAIRLKGIYDEQTVDIAAGTGSHKDTPGTINGITYTKEGKRTEREEAPLSGSESAAKGWETQGSKEVNDLSLLSRLKRAIFG